MKNKFIYLILFIAISVFSCVQKDSNRVYFTINHADKIVIPVQLNNSVTANMTFDTGGNFVLDSTFLADNIAILNYIPAITEQSGGSAWSETPVNMNLYKKTPKVRIGNISLEYEEMEVFNYKWYFNSKSDGLFNIPKNDTTHVWELNFEHNYLEIHSNEDFTIPENSFILPITKVDREISVKLPIRLECHGDTLVTNNTYVIDTGMRWDIVLMCPTYDDYDFFESKQQDAVWTSYLNGYYKHNIVNATLFDSFEVDSLRVYTFDNNHNIFGRLIGYNFLKRFNVFFDMRNQQIGLQPINNFQRILNPQSNRFHFSTFRNSNGQVIVKKVADYADNYYKTAGLQEGDEIIAIDGKLAKDITNKERKEFHTKDTLVFDIKRDEKPFKLVVHVNKNEEQGD